MKMWLDLLLLVIGFVLLLKGADAFVDGSAGVARIFKVPGVIIGLTIVAMGNECTGTCGQCISGNFRFQCDCSQQCGWIEYF